MKPETYRFSVLKVPLQHGIQLQSINQLLDLRLGYIEPHLWMSELWGKVSNKNSLIFSKLLHSHIFQVMFSEKLLSLRAVFSNY